MASTVFCSDAAKSAYDGVPGPLSSTKYGSTCASAGLPCLTTKHGGKLGRVARSAASTPLGRGRSSSQLQPREQAGAGSMNAKFASTSTSSMRMGSGGGGGGVSPASSNRSSVSYTAGADSATGSMRHSASSERLNVVGRSARR